MAEKRISLTQSKWSMMEFLWAEEPLTGWEDAALGETKDCSCPSVPGKFRFDGQRPDPKRGIRP